MEAVNITRADTILSSLDRVLKQRFDPAIINPSLSSGHLGVALFYAYYYKTTGNKEHLDYSRHLLDLCSIHYAENETVPTYCDGTAGMGWVYQHLLNQNIVDSDEDALEDYDEFLVKMGEHLILSGKYDYLHGGLGIGIYFLERRDNKKHLEKILTALESIAQVTAIGIYWEDFEARKYQKIGGRVVNFGLSHGMPSIIFFLTKLIELKIEIPRATGLLKSAIKYIVHHSDIENYAGCHFPNIHFLDENNRRKEMSRLAWCYGDLGVLVSLIQAAKVLQDGILEKQLIEMAMRTSQRKSYGETLIQDGGVCHGYSGVAHVYQRLYSYTGVQAFQETSHYWIKRLMDSIDENGGMESFKEYDIKTGQLIDSFGLLTGAAGAGLVLLSSLKPETSSDWDRFFLLS